ncbi:MAG: hypothetical protein LBQ47_04855 [Endomicrobium sp.]|jgi:hypothetical protein|nr:hypothetical protein [Endomicrobium sp.]
MKKIAMLLLVFVGAGLLFAGCGDDGERNRISSGNDLPIGWTASWEANTNSMYTLLNAWPVGQTVTFYTEVYDENYQLVTDYDTSSTTWIIEPADAATITSNVGSSVQITPTKTGTFVLKWAFKGTHGEGQTFTVV